MSACVIGGLGGAEVRAEGGCPNEPFRTGLSANLPDCRAYEQVSPPFKDGARLEGAEISADGSKLIVQVLSNFGDAGNSPSSSGSTYELARGPAGWTETALDPPASQFPWNYYLDASVDGGETLWSARATSQSLFAEDLYVREADGALHDLGPTSPPSATVGPSGTGEPANSNQFFQYRGASDDLSHVLFSTQSAGERDLLWPGDTTAIGGTASGGVFESLYEFTGDKSSEPKLVGVKNNGALASNTEAELIGDCGIDLGSGSIGDTYNAVSESGDTVFFTVLHNGECSSAQPVVSELYGRIDGSKTVAISEPILPPGEECTGKCKAAVPSEGIFQGASRDGSKVFFLTDQPLLNTDEDTTSDLYEAEIEGQGKGASAHVGKLVQVSHDPNVGQAPEVQGVVRVSEDGSHVYFVAKGVLASNSNGQAAPFDTATLGAENLYVHEPDPEHPGQDKTAFVAMLCSEDGASGSVTDAECHSSDAGLWSAYDQRPAQATPDGRFLAFSSATDLTAPEDTSTVSQVFRYDAQTGELARVAIGQDGFNANGNTSAFPASIPVRGFLSASEAHELPVAISNDGSYVAFASADGLTALALNGHPVSPEGPNPELARNVYEWHDGNVFLISDGQDATSTDAESSVRLDGTTTSGDDIFFLTADPLVPQDTDTERDLYDARLDGGFPPPSVPTPCQEEACQGPIGASPLFGTPASATFSGVGNVAPQPEAKAVAKPKPLTRAQRLAKALKACRSKSKRARSSCEKQARKRYDLSSAQAKKTSNGNRRAGR